MEMVIKEKKGGMMEKKWERKKRKVRKKPGLKSKRKMARFDSRNDAETERKK
jgi:hypothetical protein